MKLTGKILIVDDDKVTLDFFDIMLTKLDYEVIKAKDGIEALEKVKIHNPDLMLLDNLLPKMTGFEVTQIIKKDKSFSDFKDLPIIMFSALDDPEDKVLGLEMGIEDYITKPFNFSEVLARIRNVIRHKELVKQLVKLDINNKEDLSAFVLKFKDDYNSMMAMQDGIEEQIRDIENKKNKLKEDELSLEELEKKISKYLKNISKDER